LGMFKPPILYGSKIKAINFSKIKITFQRFRRILKLLIKIPNSSKPI
jgi:hypothetical protein